MKLSSIERESYQSAC